MLTQKFLPLLRFLRFQSRLRALVCGGLIASLLGSAVSQEPVLEFRYEFDAAEAPMVDSTGKHNNLGLATNGEPHRLGEDSLIGDDGFAFGLDAPGAGHPTGSYATVLDAPHAESFSVSMWIRPQFTGTSQALFARDNVWWPSPCNFYCLYMDANQSLVYKSGGVETLFTDFGVIEDGQVYHVALTHLDTDGPDSGSADRARIYVNGELLEEVDGPAEIPSLDSIADGNSIYRLFWLGTLSSLGGFWGEMDDLQYYAGELAPEQVAALYENPGLAFGTGGVTGDFDGDGQLTSADIDTLSAAIRAGSTDPTYDIDGSGSVDSGDRFHWVVEQANTYFGDANLDGEFSSTDFVLVFQAGTYEDTIAGNSGWSTGDWNGDGDFDSADFVAAFQQGGYEQGPRAAVAAVPEPHAIVLTLLGTLPAMVQLRRSVEARRWSSL
jgi:hypothetical protein